MKPVVDNKIKKFGISVYSPDKAIEALRMPEIDFIQMPFNVFDHVEALLSG